MADMGKAVSTRIADIEEKMGKTLVRLGAVISKSSKPKR
jgi:hypothetical protein